MLPQYLFQKVLLCYLYTALDIHILKNNLKKDQVDPLTQRN